MSHNHQKNFILFIALAVTMSCSKTEPEPTPTVVSTTSSSNSSSSGSSSSNSTPPNCEVPIPGAGLTYNFTFTKPWQPQFARIEKLLVGTWEHYVDIRNDHSQTGPGLVTYTTSSAYYCKNRTQLVFDNDHTVKFINGGAIVPLGTYSVYYSTVWNSLALGTTSSLPTGSTGPSLNGSEFKFTLLSQSVGNHYTDTYSSGYFKVNDTGPFRGPLAPELSTANVTVVGINTITSGGNVTSDDGSAVAQRGVYWSRTNLTFSGPAITDSRTVDGSGLGAFASNFTFLPEAGVYYVCAYATNAGGTGYGEVISFNTGLPYVGTSAVTGITQTMAVSGGFVSPGSSATTARGLCWNTNSAPTTANNKTSDGAGDGSFTSNITGLTGGTTYFVRAYGTNSSGTSYGTEVSFKTN